MVPKNRKALFKLGLDLQAVGEDIFHSVLGIAHLAGMMS